MSLSPTPFLPSPFLAILLLIVNSVLGFVMYKAKQELQEKEQRLRDAMNVMEEQLETEEVAPPRFNIFLFVIPVYGLFYLDGWIDKNYRHIAIYGRKPSIRTNGFVIDCFESIFSFTVIFKAVGWILFPTILLFKFYSFGVSLSGIGIFIGVDIFDSYFFLIKAIVAPWIAPVILVVSVFSILCVISLIPLLGNILVLIFFDVLGNLVRGSYLFTSFVLKYFGMDKVAEETLKNEKYPTIFCFLLLLLAIPLVPEDGSKVNFLIVVLAVFSYSISSMYLAKLIAREGGLPRRSLSNFGFMMDVFELSEIKDVNDDKSNMKI